MGCSEFIAAEAAPTDSRQLIRGFLNAQINSKESSVEYSDITCPVCGLACDDLRVTVENEKVRVHDLPCRTGEGFFTSAWPADSESITPEIKGENASFDDAITQAGKLLANANAPVVSGLMTDVQGTRSCIGISRSNRCLCRS